MFYPALGLAGEVGEIANKIKKILRGDSKLEDRLNDLRAEAGDVLWYVAALATDLGFPMKGNVTDTGVAYALKDSNLDRLDIYSTVLRMNAHSGAISLLADDYRFSMADRLRIEMGKLLGIFLAYFSHFIVLLNTTFEDVAKANIQKLFKRRDEGLIKGDGDNRTSRPPYRIQNRYQDGGWEEANLYFKNLADAISKAEKCSSDSIAWGMVRIVDADDKILHTYGAGETSRKVS